MNKPTYMNQNLNQGNTETINGNTTNPLFAIEAKPYVCVIKGVEDSAEHSALIISFDIDEGELKGVFYKDCNGDMSKWNRKGKIWISYEEKNKDLFEAFITAVRRSNPNFVWDWNEQKLLGKRIVVVYGVEEFLTKDTKEVKNAVKPRMVRSYEALTKGEIKPVPLKKLKNIAPNNYTNRNYKPNNQGYNYQQPTTNYSKPTNIQEDVEVDDSDLPL